MKGVFVGAISKEKKRIACVAVVVFAAIVLYRVLDDPAPVRRAAGALFRAVRPILWGLALAFAADIPTSFIERKPLGKLRARRKKLVRAIAAAISYAAAAGAVCLVASLVVPKALESLRLLASNLGDYIAAVSERMDGMTEKLELSPEVCDMLSGAADSAVSRAKGLAEELVPKLPGFTMSAISGVFRLFITVAISVHAVINKEKMLRFFKRAAMAALPEKRIDGFLHSFGIAAETFRRYLTGQAASCLIIGVLCYIGMRISSMPYPELISVFICVAALIPVIGPWASTVPSAIIILMARQDEPALALWFVLMIVAIQLVDDNLVYPRIVGDAVGVPGILVIASVAAGGALFGIPGLVIAVPTAAVAYRLFGEWTEARLGGRREAKKEAA
ncbi:MAG: AI-2E family transporter [Clostridia bacterium]|nr:AI-2E family transporter [Clostridia bacterium]